MKSVLSLLSLMFLVAPVDPTLPPESAHVAYTVAGQGVQVYQCMPQPDHTEKWTFQEPAADLFDPTTKEKVGSHSAGPTWTWKDGSAVVGKLLAKADSPLAGAVPWLLLEAHSTGEPGVLSKVKYVRRSDTQAGAAPATGCDATRVGTTVRVPYVATYTFYTATP